MGFGSARRQLRAQSGNKVFHTAATRTHTKKVKQYVLDFMRF